ncbi:alanine racemase [Melaminivora sp.]|uniref:alanine racemase n=1 Tax=Melaminivora sp. TaxID=1933032 RepID=UPI0028AB3C7B|nr:alanine racemase [Melaminivora sp.]
MSADRLAHDGPRLVVDLQALAHNWRAVQRACPHARVGAVVKNDAYGLGVQHVVPTLWTLGCRDFWVATAREALALPACLPADARAQGLQLWVLNGLAGADPRDFGAHGLTPVLAGPHEAAALAGYAAAAGGPLPVAVQLDTGLTRLGFGLPDLALLQPGRALWRDARPLLWLTHLGRFHDPAAPQCLQQRSRFEQWTGALPAAARSIATSSSVFAGHQWHFDHVRTGSALWGVPTGAPGAPLHPVARLEAPVLRVVDVPAGTEIGYAGSYITTHACRVATVALGYGDGLPFGLVNRGHLMVAGRPAPVLGGVAMGLVGVDVSAHAPGEVVPGMWAEVYGPQQPLATVAGWAGVAPNVLLTLTARLAAQRSATPGGPA